MYWGFETASPCSWCYMSKNNMSLAWLEEVWWGVCPPAMDMEAAVEIGKSHGLTEDTVYAMCNTKWVCYGNQTQANASATCDGFNPYTPEHYNQVSRHPEGNI